MIATRITLSCILLRRKKQWGRQFAISQIWTSHSMAGFDQGIDNQSLIIINMVNIISILSEDSSAYVRFFMLDLESKQQIKQNGDMMHYTILAQIFCCRTTQIIQDDCLSTEKASPCYTCLKRVSCCLFLFPPHLIHGKKTVQQIWTKDFPHFEVAIKNIVFWEDFPCF